MKTWDDMDPKTQTHAANVAAWGVESGEWDRETVQYWCKAAPTVKPSVVARMSKDSDRWRAACRA